MIGVLTWDASHGRLTGWRRSSAALVADGSAAQAESVFKSASVRLKSCQVLIAEQSQGRLFRKDRIQSNHSGRLIAMAWGRTSRKPIHNEQNSTDWRARCPGRAHKHSDGVECASVRGSKRLDPDISHNKSMPSYKKDNHQIFSVQIIEKARDVSNPGTLRLPQVE